MSYGFHRYSRTIRDDIQPPHDSNIPPRARAFSLIEFIAVLAVIALLAAVLVPAMVRRISQANVNREAANLATLADALKQQALRQRTIPNGAGWLALVQNELNLAPKNISSNAIGYARAFLIDPNLSIGATTAASLPFIQTSNGVATVPSNVRFLIVSSLNQPLPVWVSNGVASSTAIFSNIWHTLDDGVPAGWPAAWTGKGDQLKIQRLDLGSEFRRLILNPIDPNRYGKAAIEASVPKLVTNIQSAWYLAGTLVGLYDTNNVANTNFLEGREFLHADRSYVYENGLWRAQIFDGKEPPPNNNSSNPYASVFNASMAAFTATPPQSPMPGNGASPSMVMSMYYSMMLDYYHWSITPFNQGSFYFDMLQKDVTDLTAAVGELGP